jgi:hypothetical protein
MKHSCVDAVIARPLHTSSSNPADALVPPLPKCSMSTIINNFSKCDSAPPTQMLTLCKSGGDQNDPEPKASADQNVLQHQKATCQAVKKFMEANCIHNDSFGGIIRWHELDY